MSLRLQSRRSAPPSSPKYVPKPRARIDMKVSPYLYVAPFFILFAIFGAYPLVYTAWVSLHDWNLIGDNPAFVGLANYAELIGDDRFWNAVGNTLAMFIVATVPQLLIALGVANLLNRQLRARTAFRMGILIPNITSVAAVGIVFSLVFARDFGIVNYILGLIGVPNIDWTAHRWSSWIAIAVMVDWRWIGYNALIYLAGMQAIPRDLYEAAAIDGASKARQFWSITVPLLRPTIIFTTIIATIGGLQLFTEPLMLHAGRINGGSLRQGQTITMYLYEQAFTGDYKYGYGSAIAWMLFLLILIISALNVWLIRRSTR